MRALLAAAGCVATTAFAQIATDGSLGARQSFIGQNITIPSSIGRYVNGNLFHSFQVFNVTGGQAVTFLPTPITLQTPTMNNIIGRVTGGTPSTIQGTIRSTAPGVNLYLINPSGIVIGFDALIDVNGSFYASTAHYLRSADGTKFESRGPGISLTFTSPDGFGFDSSTVAPMTFQGGTVRVREGATLGLVGGPLLVGHQSQLSTLQALGGTVALVAVASPGVVEYGTQGFNPAGFGAMADVTVQSGAVINANEGVGRTGGGTIYVRGANVGIERSTLTARSAFASGRRIDIEGTGDVSIRQSSVVGVTTGVGNAAAIRLAGRNVTLSNGTIVDTSCDPGCTTGNGGPIEVRADDTFLIDGTAARASLVSNTFGRGHTGEIDVTAGRLVIDGNAAIQGIGSARSLISGTQGSGDASAIRIHSGEILLRDGGQVDVSTRGAGRGGQIVVDNSGAIRIIGFRVDPGSSNQAFAPSGFFAGTGDLLSPTATGNAGSIVVSTRTLEVLGGGQINSVMVKSSGAGGSITVNASESIRISGQGNDEQTKRSAIVTNALSTSTGDAGSISLNAPSIVVDGGAVIQSVSEGIGRAGEIRISGRDMTISGFRSQVSSETRHNADGGGDAGVVDIRLTGTLLVTSLDRNCAANCAGISSSTITSARGGTVNLDVGRLVVQDGARISSTTERAGAAGSITIRAAEDISVSGNATISSAAQFATTTGAAGSIDARARQVRVTDGARITTSTIGPANAGTIFVQGTESISLASHGSIQSETTSTGAAGSVSLQTDGQLAMQGDARVSTSTSGSGAAGGVSVVARKTIDVSSGATIASESSSSGAAGNVDVRSDGNVALHDGGRVSTSTTGAGNAGSVAVFGHDEVGVTTGAAVTSEAASTGRGGTVQVRSDGQVTLGSGGRVSTSTTGAGAAGSVSVLAGRTIDVSSSASIASESSSSGAAGTVDVRSEGTVALHDGGRVSTSTTGSGDAGTVTLYGRERIQITSGASVASESSGAGLAGNLDVRSGGVLAITDGGRITTAATFSDGGNIVIESPEGFMDGGRITTAVGTGQGDGGNMDIRIPTFVLNNSTISANAFGGDGGNIHIGTETLFKSANSSVTASSTLGVDGTITLDSPAIDPAGQLLPPSPSYLDAGAVLAGRCGARLAGRASSLVIVPRAAQGALSGGLHTTFDSSLADPWYATNALACETPRQ